MLKLAETTLYDLLLSTWTYPSRIQSLIEFCQAFVPSNFHGSIKYLTLFSTLSFFYTANPCHKNCTYVMFCCIYHPQSVKYQLLSLSAFSGLVKFRGKEEQNISTDILQYRHQCLKLDKFSVNSLSQYVMKDRLCTLPIMINFHYYVIMKSNRCSVIF